MRYVFFFLPRLVGFFCFVIRFEVTAGHLLQFGGRIGISITAL